MDKKRGAAVLCLILAVILGTVAIYKYNEEKHAGASYDDLRETAFDKNTDTASTDQTASLEETDRETQGSTSVEIPVDFKALQEINPDIYAWIQIPGTSVDYPIVQSPDDNSYYLDHTAEREAKPEGAIFTEDYNTKTFEDPNTVIYGHRMTNDSMFNSLKKYTDRSFFDENREVIIYMPDKILHYKIFAAYLYDNRHLMQSFDFWDTAIFEAYLKNISAMRSMDAFVDTSMDVTGTDRIITLSTCKAGEHDKRYLVQAVQISIEE